MAKHYRLVRQMVLGNRCAILLPTLRRNSVFNDLKLTNDEWWGQCTIFSRRLLNKMMSTSWAVSRNAAQPYNFIALLFLLIETKSETENAKNWNQLKVKVKAKNWKTAKRLTELTTKNTLWHSGATGRRLCVCISFSNLCWVFSCVQIRAQKQEIEHLFRSIEFS